MEQKRTYFSKTIVEKVERVFLGGVRERREKEREVEGKRGERVRETREKDTRKSERDEKSRVASFQIFSLKVYSRVKLDRKSKKQTSSFSSVG